MTSLLRTSPLLASPLLASLLLASLLSAASAAEPPASSRDAELDALLGALAQPTPADTAFVEQRASSLLSEPLVLVGRLSHPRAGELVKQVDRPYREHTRIAQGRVEMERHAPGKAPQRRRFSLRHAPDLAGLLAGFEGVLAGDRRLLERHFTLVLQAHDGGRWTLRMQPRDARLARRVEALALHGEGGSLHCLEVVDVDGDGSRMLVGRQAERLAAATAGGGGDAAAGVAASAAASAAAIASSVQAACGARPGTD